MSVSSGLADQSIILENALKVSLMLIDCADRLSGHIGKEDSKLPEKVKNTFIILGEVSQQFFKMAEHVQQLEHQSNLNKVEIIKKMNEAKGLLSGGEKADPTEDDLERIQKIANEALQLVIPIRNVSNPCPFFTGREEILNSVHSKFTQNSGPVVLYGPGGMGKTEIALKYVLEWEKKYSIVWFIRAGSQDQLQTSYRTLGRALEIESYQGLAYTDLRNRVHHKLENREGWLLIYDDANTELEFPKNGGNVLITTRDKTPFSRCDEVWIPPLLREESKALIEKKFVQSSEVESLAARCGDHPLIVDQVTTYIAQTPGQTIESYLQESVGMDFQRMSPNSHYPCKVEDLVGQAKSQLSPTQLRWLDVCSHLDGEKITRRLLELWLTHSKQEGNAEEIEKALVHRGLLRYHDESHSYSMEHIFQVLFGTEQGFLDLVLPLLDISERKGDGEIDWNRHLQQIAKSHHLISLKNEKRILQVLRGGLDGQSSLIHFTEYFKNIVEMLVRFKQLEPHYRSLLINWIQKLECSDAHKRMIACCLLQLVTLAVENEYALNGAMEGMESQSVSLLDEAFIQRLSEIFMKIISKEQSDVVGSVCVQFLKILLGRQGEETHSVADLLFWEKLSSLYGNDDALELDCQNALELYMSCLGATVQQFPNQQLSLSFDGGQWSFQGVQRQDHSFFGRLKQSMKQTRFEVSNESLIQLVKINPEWKKLVIARCPQITSQALIAIAHHCHRIEHLELGEGIVVDDATLVTFAYSHPHLKELIIQESDHITDAAFFGLSRSCTDLRGLELGKCRNLDSNTLGIIGSRFRQLKRLMLFDIRGLTRTGVECFTMDFPQLEEFGLTSSQGPLVPGFVSSIVQKLNHLKKLHLESNPSSEVSWDCFLKMLPEKCHELTHLHLNVKGKVSEESIEILEGKMRHLKFPDVTVNGKCMMQLS